MYSIQNNFFLVGKKGMIHSLLGKDSFEVDVDFIVVRGNSSGGGGGSSSVSSCTAKCAGLRAVGGSVALFSLVLNSIAASWESAVSSASVGGEVRVGWSSITLFVSFNNTITAFGSNFKEVDWSAVSGLEASVVVREDTSELRQLASRNGDWVGKDEPVSVL